VVRSRQDEREEYQVGRGREGGETLVEILISVVIIGLVVGAIFATYTAAATASKSQRDLVTADAELRDYAEAIHAAAEKCTSGAPLSPAPPASPYPYAVDAAPLVCPSVDGVQPIDISVTPTNGTPAQKLTTYVRTP
jgi:type II secretory pathway pseudopilin PulG